MSSRVATRRRGLPHTAGVAVASDKRFRRADVRPGRRTRASQIVVRSIASLLAALVVTFGGLWLARTAAGARMFAVSRIVVSGNSRLSSGEVESLVDGLRGQSVWTVDFEQYRRKVMDSPWVADVTLWRVLPATVELRVVERVPLAVARLGSQLYLVDRSGFTIAEYSAQYRTFDLPVIDGLIVPPAAGAPRIDEARVSLARRFLDAVHASELRDRVSQIDVSNARDAIVVLDAETVFLHVGDDRFVERLRTYVDLGPTLRERFSQIDYVDLRFGERVYVRPVGEKTAVDAGKARVGSKHQ